MSVIQKEYFTVRSIANTGDDPSDAPGPISNEEPPYPPPHSTPIPPMPPGPSGGPGDPELLLTNLPIAIEHFPQWFVNALPKYRKIIRVLGATVNWVNQNDFLMSDPVPLNPGYRLFSNIVTNSNIVMKTVLVTLASGMKRTYVGREGFVMMVNNYNSVKEFDVTNENLKEIQLFLRPWHSYTQEVPASPVDFVCELELLLIDDS